MSSTTTEKGQVEEGKNDHEGFGVCDYYEKFTASSEPSNTNVARSFLPNAHPNHRAELLYRTPRHAGRSRTWLSKTVDEYSRKGDKIGEGTYGSVYHALTQTEPKETRTNVALKVIRMGSDHEGFPENAVRELNILKTLNHKNIVSLLDVVANEGAENKDFSSAMCYLVLEYLDYDLAGLVENPKVKFSTSQIKYYFRELLMGLEYCHKMNVIHRDVKGSNVLIGADGALKLTDFGLATFKPRHNHGTSNRVITLWFRAPELMLGATHYGYEVDMWSAGCVFLEMLTGRPPFQGYTELEQFRLICEHFGTPSPDNYPDGMRLPWFKQVKPDEFFVPGVKRPHIYSSSTPGFSAEANDLLTKLVVMDPKRRLTATEALAHPYFSTAPLPERPPRLTCEHSHEYETKKRNKANAKKRRKMSRSSPTAAAAAASSSSSSHRHHNASSTHAGSSASSSRRHSQSHSSSSSHHHRDRSRNYDGHHRREREHRSSRHRRTPPKVAAAAAGGSSHQPLDLTSPLDTPTSQSTSSSYRHSAEKRRRPGESRSGHGEYDGHKRRRKDNHSHHDRKHSKSSKGPRNGYSHKDGHHSSKSKGGHLADGTHSHSQSHSSSQESSTSYSHSHLAPHSHKERHRTSSKKSHSSTNGERHRDRTASRRSRSRSSANDHHSHSHSQPVPAPSPHTAQGAGPPPPSAQYPHQPAPPPAGAPPSHYPHQHQPAPSVAHQYPPHLYPAHPHAAHHPQAPPPYGHPQHPAAAAPSPYTAAAHHAAAYAHYAHPHPHQHPQHPHPHAHMAHAVAYHHPPHPHVHPPQQQPLPPGYPQHAAVAQAAHPHAAAAAAAVVQYPPAAAQTYP